MDILNMHGKKFDGTSVFEFANYDTYNLKHYFDDITFIKNQVYKTLLDGESVHRFEKDALVDFLSNLKTNGLEKNLELKPTIYFDSLFNDFIENLIDEIIVDELGGHPLDFNCYNDYAFKYLPKDHHS